MRLMDLGLPTAYFLLSFGTVQMMLGLIFIAAHAWQKSIALGMATAICFPLVGIYWAFGPYKCDGEAQHRELRMAMFICGLVTMVLAAILVYSVSIMNVALGVAASGL